MDNVTHALAGCLIAEGAIALRRRRSGAAPFAGFARLAYVVSAVANNIPDADFVYTWITPGKLGYLLHHRGHTHTLPIGIALGLAIAAIALAFARRRGAVIERRDAAWIWALGFFGPVVHMSMDAWNVYGVHPFWPFYDGWFYGDSIFIVEPLLWATMIPPLLFAARSRAWRIVLGALLALIVALPWIATSFVPVALRLNLLADAALMLLLAWRLRGGARAAAGIGATAIIVLGFVIAGRITRGEIARRLAVTDAHAHARTHDLALSPLPANPLCWTAIAVQTSPQSELILRRATIAPWPALFPVERCPATRAAIAAPIESPAPSSDPQLRWEGDFRGPLARLRALARDNCEVAALLRFTRAPFWIDGADTVVVGDLRFARGAGFAELEIPTTPAHCPAFVPPWLPPRSDVLDGR